MTWYEWAIDIITSIINVFGICFLTLNTRQEKMVINKNRLYLSIVIIIITTIIMTFFSSLRIVLGYLSILIIIFIIDQQNFKKNIITYILLFAFGLVEEILMLLTTEKLFNINLFQLTTLHYQSVALLFMFIWFFSWYFFSKHFSVYKLVNKIESFITNYFTIEVLTVLLLLATSFVFLDYYYGKINSKFVIGYVVVINLLFGLIILYIKKNNKNKKLESYNEVLKKLIEEYEKIIEDYKIVRHNLISDFLIIRSKANDECIKLVDYKISEYYKNFQWINEISKIPKGLQGLIYAKKALASEKKVNLFIKSNNTNKNKELSFSNKIYNDFCKSVSLIFDNAIDACLLTKQKVIIVDIIKKNNSINIKISNSFSNFVDLDKIGERGYTTKGIMHGIGLNYIKKSISKDIKINYKIVNDIFVTDIFITNKKAN